MMVAFASAGLAREDGTLVDPGGNKLMKAKVASIPALWWEGREAGLCLGEGSGDDDSPAEGRCLSH